MFQVLIKKALPHIIAVVTFLVLNVAYFYPQLEGKKVRSGDIVSYVGMSKEVSDLAKQGENPLWTNAMFGGMPTYQIGAPQKGNKIGYLEQIQQLGFSRPIGYFMALMIGFYILLVSLGVSPWLSIIGSIGFGFSTNHFILFEAGHMTKLRVIAQFASIIAGVILVFRKRYLIGGVLFAVGMGIGIYGNHIQMMYYLGLMLIIYVLIEIIQHLQQGKIIELLKAGSILTVGLLLGIGSSASKLMTTYEYSKDTMRGEPILAVQTNNTTPSSSSEVSGLDYEYAMQWSNGVLDVFASLIPGVVGGGSGEEIASTSATATAMRKKGASISQAPLYWGDLPFTSGPVYFGAIFIFLFVLGSLLVEGPIKWWLCISVLLTLLLSMGRNFDFLTRLLFDFLPMYNKFRAPNSILSVTAILIPLLGILGISKIIRGEVLKSKAIKSVYIAGGIIGGIALFFALLGPNLFDMASAGDARYQQAGWDTSAFIADRQSLMRTDAFRTLLFVIISAGLVWAFLKDKIGQLVLIGGLGLLILFDMWSVGKRYLGTDKFVAPNRVNTDYQPRPIDQQIFTAERIDPNNPSANPVGRGGYRVFDLSINTFNSSQTSYFHNTIGGYHAAKLQRFQDLIDHHISKGNQSVLNMLNTKYVITREGQLQTNPAANGPAWFVETIKKVNTPNEEIEALKGLNTSTEAVVLDGEFNNYIGNFDPQKNGAISLTNYKPHHLTYTSNASSEQLAVFSEIWYGPDKGWQAYLDGKPVEHIRANYALRAMKVPAGNHKVEFKFEPSVYYLGESISLISSLLTLLGVLFFLGYRGYKLNGEKSELVVEREELVTKMKEKEKKLKPTKRKKSKR